VVLAQQVSLQAENNAAACGCSMEHGEKGKRKKALLSPGPAVPDSFRHFAFGKRAWNSRIPSEIYYVYGWFLILRAYRCKAPHLTGFVLISMDIGSDEPASDFG
jgi:hypothetical protein